MKPKILYLVTKSNWGGAQKYVFDLSTAAQNEGYEVCVGLGGNGVLKEKLENNKIKVIEIFNLERDIVVQKEMNVFFDLISIFKKEKPETVHLNSSKIGALGSLAARITGVKNIIYTAHGWAFNEKVSVFSKIFRMTASWVTILCCHKVIVLSEREKKQVAAWPLTANKIVIIPIGIKPFETLEKDQAKNKLNINSDDFIVGTIAELHKNKGLDTAIEAVKDLNVKFFIIGEGEEKESLKLKIKSLKLEGKVFLLGNIENASTFLKAFDVFLIASRKEGLPYVLLEAGYAKVPVIATKVGGIPEIIKNYETGLLVNEGDTKEIEKAILQTIHNSSRAKEMSEKLSKTVETVYLSDKMTHSTIALYKNKDTIV